MAPAGAGVPGDHAPVASPFCANGSGTGADARGASPANGSGSGADARANGSGTLDGGDDDGDGDASANGSTSGADEGPASGGGGDDGRGKCVAAGDAVRGIGMVPGPAPGPEPTAGMPASVGGRGALVLTDTGPSEGNTVGGVVFASTGMLGGDAMGLVGKPANGSGMVTPAANGSGRVFTSVAGSDADGGCESGFTPPGAVGGRKIPLRFDDELNAPVACAGGAVVAAVDGCACAAMGGDVPGVDEPEPPLARNTWLHLLQRTRIGPWANFSSPTLKRVWHCSQEMITAVG